MSQECATTLEAFRKEHGLPDDDAAVALLLRIYAETDQGQRARAMGHEPERRGQPKVVDGVTVGSYIQSM